jgi:hypothetical protein
MTAKSSVKSGKQHKLGDGKRIVIKVGSALMADESKGAVRADWLANLAAEIAKLKAGGRDVVMVSSGAIAVGRLHLASSPASCRSKKNKRRRPPARFAWRMPIRKLWRAMTSPSPKCCSRSTIPRSAAAISTRATPSTPCSSSAPCP